MRATSPDRSPALYAIESGNGSRITPGRRRIIHSFSACSNVSKIGMSWVPFQTCDRSAFGIISRIWSVSGSVQKKKREEKSKAARRKFIHTPANKIQTCFHQRAFGRASLSRLSGLDISSHLSLTNHPRGSQLIVHSVPCLSRKSRLSLGGIPIPNSCTRTPLHRDTRKCHIS